MILTSRVFSFPMVCVFTSQPTDGLAFRLFSSPHALTVLDVFINFAYVPARRFAISFKLLTVVNDVKCGFRHAMEHACGHRREAKVLPFPPINPFLRAYGGFPFLYLTQSSTTLLGGQFTQQHMQHNVADFENGTVSTQQLRQHKQEQHKTSIGWQPI